MQLRYSAVTAATGINFGVKWFLSLIHLHHCVATTMLTMLMHQTATELAKLRST